MNTKSLIKFGIFGIFVFVSVLTYRLYIAAPAGVDLGEKARLREYVVEPLPQKEVSRVQAYVNHQMKGVSATDAEPALCQEQRKRILTMNTNDLMTEIQNGRLVVAAECKKFDTALAEQSFIEMIYANCARHDEGSSESMACATGLFFYKSILVSKANRGRDLRDLDTQGLIHEFFADLGTSNFKTPEALERMKQVGDRLVELRPESPSAYKAALLPRMIQATDAIRAGGEPDASVYEAMDRALDMNPGDQQVENMAYLLQAREGAEVSLEKAGALAASQPDSASAQIFYAKALARHKDYEAATVYVNDLAARFPNDQRVIEAQKRLAKNPAEFGTFEMSLGSDL